MIDQQSIHGHEVLHLIHSASAPLTRLALESEIFRRFGPDPRFHTCSLSGLTLDELLEFLTSHGKVVERDGRLSIDLSQICAHG